MFPIDLTATQIQCFQKLRTQMELGLSLAELKRQCHLLAQEMSQEAMASHRVTLADVALYAAIIDAHQSGETVNFSRTLELLGLAEGHPFAVFLARYIRETMSMQPSALAFESTVPFDVWAASSYHKEYRAQTQASFRRFVKQLQAPRVGQVPTLCDIGPGTGAVLVELIELLFAQFSLAHLQVFLVEMSPEMLQASRRLLTQRFGDRVSCRSLTAKIQELTTEDLRKASGGGKWWFATGSASLHHMPYEKKREVFQNLAPLTDTLVVSDFYAHHDLPEKDSPELIFSVTNFYGYVMDDLWRTADASEEHRWLAIRDLFLTESLNILNKDRANRIDYHAEPELWDKLAREAGFEVLSGEFTTYDEQRPVSFTKVYRTRS